MTSPAEPLPFAATSAPAGPEPAGPESTGPEPLAPGSVASGSVASEPVTSEPVASGPVAPGPEPAGPLPAGPLPAGSEPAAPGSAGTRSFLFLLGSARRDGNTERLARAAETGLPEGVARRWLRLADHPLPPFSDLRHEGDGRYAAPDGPAAVLLDATLQATDLVIASPLYWYSLSAATKLYLDHWTAWMRVPGIDFRARMGSKTMWVVCAYSSDDVVMAEPLLGTLRLCADYFGMRWGGQVLARANRPGGVKPEALATAADLFRP